MSDQVDLLRRAPIWRDYPALLKRHGLSVEAPLPPPADRHEAMRRAIDLLWGGVGSTGISWVGFYEKLPGSDEMVLVCREPKPACSPIGLHGMCGRGWRERRPIIIANVRTLGPNYIACDPKDQSELVVPVIAADGSCDAVLDVDSYDIGAFDEHDAMGMTKLMVALGLTIGMSAAPMRL
ncbi:MAG: GAF domain-containing protein [Planctomycetes bacterium]|nr:GAF domain-containing protein [Planctomycetota bacterium]